MSRDAAKEKIAHLHCTYFLGHSLFLYFYLINSETVHSLKFKLILLVLLSSPDSAAGQSPVYLSKWKTFDTVDRYLSLFIDSTNSTDFVSIPADRLEKIPTSSLMQTPVLSQLLLPHYFSITLINDQPDTAHFFFYISPQEKIEVKSYQTKATGSVLPIIKKIRGSINRQLYPISIPPRDTLRCLLKIHFQQAPLVSCYFFLIPSAQAGSFIWYWDGYGGQDLFTLIFIGMLLMMGIYMMVKYSQVKRNEYVFYSGYIFFMAIYFVIKQGETKEVLFFSSSRFIYGYAERMAQIAAYAMYFPFFQSFLRTKQTIPGLHRQLTYASYVLCGYALIDLALMFLPHLIQIQFSLWSWMRIALLTWTAYAAITIWRKKQGQISYYLVAGGASLGVFAMLAMLFSFYYQLIASLPAPLSNPLFYFELGIIIELLFFSAGLGYKNRLDEKEKVSAQQALQIESERQQFELYRSIAETREGERSRIAKDLHDGVGGLLSGVRISLSNIKNKVTLNKDDELIFARSLDMLDGSMQELRRVAHAMKPPSLEVFGLKTALRDYVEAINSMKTLKIVFQTVGDERRLASEQELIVYRIVQELLNNVVKHAQAKECLVQVSYLSAHLSITVEDDGNGFDTGQESNGMGLTNIHQRVEFLKGGIDLNSSKQTGTSVQINIPFK